MWFLDLSYPLSNNHKLNILQNQVCNDVSVKIQTLISKNTLSNRQSWWETVINNVSREFKGAAVQYILRVFRENVMVAHTISGLDTANLSFEPGRSSLFSNACFSMKRFESRKDRFSIVSYKVRSTMGRLQCETFSNLPAERHLNKKDNQRQGKYSLVALN